MSRYFWPLVLAALLVGCDSQPSEEAADQAEIALFERLAMPVIGLRFPRSRDHLETCRRVRDVHCVGAYRSFHAAKDELLAKPRRKALELTLARLSESCVAERYAERGFVCIGAVIALAFFPEDAEDERIRQFLAQLARPHRESLLDQSAGNGVTWLDNRADRTAWRSWLESQIEDEAVRSRVIARLESPDAGADAVYDLVLESGDGF